MPFGISQYVQFILHALSKPVSSFVFHSSLLTAKRVDLVVAMKSFFYIDSFAPFFSDRSTMKPFVLNAAMLMPNLFLQGDLIVSVR